MLLEPCPHKHWHIFLKPVQVISYLGWCFSLCSFCHRLADPFFHVPKQKKGGGMETWEAMGDLEVETQEHDERWPELSLGSGVLQQRVRRARKGQWEAQRREHQMRLETLIQEEEACPSLPNEKQEQFKSQEQCGKVNCKERAWALWKETVPEGTQAAAAAWDNALPRQRSLKLQLPHGSDVLSTAYYSLKSLQIGLPFGL